MTSPPATLQAFTDAAADAVARAIASVHREAARERDLREAEHRARLADLETRLLSAADIERRLNERLEALRDGDPGKDGERGEQGEKGEPGDVGPQGDKGETGDPGKDGERGEQGEKGEPGDVGPQGDKGETGDPGKDGEPGRDGIDGKDGLPGENGRDGASGEKGERGDSGKDGERGPEGPPGKLPVVREWMEGVWYQADVVSRAGATYQAIRDTGREPPGDDWQLLAGSGRDGTDGRSFAIRGTWSEDESYSHLDVVMLGGSSFAARRDDPGPCPGDGWQVIATPGKIGKPGPRGERGDRGPAGPAVVAAAIDDEGLLTIKNGDGSAVTCDLYPLLTRVMR